MRLPDKLPPLPDLPDYTDKPQPETIDMPVWCVKGIMWVRRDVLDPDDPDHPYNYLKARGLTPERYGFYKTCPHCGEPN